MKNFKISLLLVFSLLAVFMFLFNDSRTGVGQKRETVAVGATASLPNLPDIDRFDTAVQKRFLTEPSFGMARMTPTTPQPLESAHVRSFHPKDGVESLLVDEFTRDGWRVGLYLFGRSARPKEKKDNPMDSFDIRYRINQPVPVTLGLHAKELPGAKKLIDDVKNAFLKFQGETDTVGSEVRFEKGDWTFVAKPVRAVNDSCIRCHTDYVITEKLDDGKFKFRKRAVGDVNGIIVYGYSRNDR